MTSAVKSIPMSTLIDACSPSTWIWKEDDTALLPMGNGLWVTYKVERHTSGSVTTMVLWATLHGSFETDPDEESLSWSRESKMVMAIDRERFSSMVNTLHDYMWPGLVGGEITGKTRQHIVQNMLRAGLDRDLKARQSLMDYVSSKVPTLA